jgi:Na+/alanine symporter
LIAVLTGCIMSLPIIWAFADVAMGVLTLLNVTAILRPHRTRSFCEKRLCIQRSSRKAAERPETG